MGHLGCIDNTTALYVYSSFMSFYSGVVLVSGGIHVEIDIRAFLAIPSTLSQFCVVGPLTSMHVKA